MDTWGALNMKLNDINVGNIVVRSNYGRHRPMHGNRYNIIDTERYLVISKRFYELSTQVAVSMTVAPIESNKLGESMYLTAYSLPDYEIPEESGNIIFKDIGESLRVYPGHSVPIDLALFIGIPVYTMKKSNTHLSKAKTSKREGSYHCKDYCTKSEITSVIGLKLIDTDKNISYNMSYQVFYKKNNMDLFSEDLVKKLYEFVRYFGGFITDVRMGTIRNSTPFTKYKFRLRRYGSSKLHTNFEEGVKLYKEYNAFRKNQIYKLIKYRHDNKLKMSDISELPKELKNASS